MVTIDNISPPGAWRREWDAQPHTPQEYMQKIRELRERNADYVREIDRLERKIDELKEELALVNKYIYKNGVDDAEPR
jgi:predicted RNase H-like nuclease (RuvC/YqgF family)